MSLYRSVTSRCSDVDIIVSEGLGLAVCMTSSVGPRESLVRTFGALIKQYLIHRLKERLHTHSIVFLLAYLIR